MVEEVAAPPALAGPRSRRDSEVTKQLADLFSHFLAMHNHIDQTMFLQKFGSLKSFGQILMRRFFAHAGAGESDHAFGLSDNNIAQRRETGHDSSGSWICKNRNVWEPFLGVSRQRAACFCHLHQAQHSFVHARAAGSRNDDDRAALGCAIFNRSSNLLANDRTHGRSEKTEVHHRDRHFVAVKNSIATYYSVEQSGAFVVFLEPIFIRNHSLETQDVHGFQVGIHFHKSFRVEQILNPLHSRLRKVIVAAGTNTLILRQLGLRHHFRTAGALLKKAPRNFSLLTGLRLDCWLPENSM